MPLSRPSALPLLLLASVLAFAGAAPARAQVPGLLQVPGVQVPGAGLPGVRGLPLPRADTLLRDPLAITRTLQVDALLREQHARVARDPQGAPVLRGEFLAMDLDDDARDAVQAAGFSIERGEDGDDALGLSLRVVRDTRGREPAAALHALQQAAPDATFSYQHIYLPAGGDGGDASQATGPSAARRVGLVDGGVDGAHPTLSRARIERHGCTSAAASRHGTAVASRLVGGDRGTTLYAADLWCGDAVGGATSALVDALAWMARERVAVVNISLVGPDNPVLARAVKAMVARGHVLVSAVGNDGPAAPPLFPAAYPGVIGVSGVDAKERVLPESGRGAHVDFSASGVVGRGRDALRGTSFAAPIVARRAAGLLDAPRAGAADQVQQRLAADARDLGVAGRDPRYGVGLLAP